MSGDESASLGSEIQERVPFYALASRLLLEEVHRETFDRLRADPVRSVLVAADSRCEEWLDQEWDDARELSLREEYARLFLMSSGVPPFVSACLEGDREKLGLELHDFVTGVLRALAREPRVVQPWGRLPLDHLGLILELIHLAAEEGTEVTLQIAQQVEKELLGEWVIVFSRTLVKKAKEPLYAALGHLLEDLWNHRGRVPGES